MKIDFSRPDLMRDPPWLPVLRPRGRAANLALTLGLVGAATLAQMALRLADPSILPFPFYFPALLISALAGGWWAGGLALSLAGVLAWFLFIVPQFGVAGHTGWIDLALFLLVGTALVRLGVTVRRFVRRIEDGEAALAERTRRYDSLFASMIEGFAICEAVRDSEGVTRDFRIVEINPALEALLRAPAALTGTRMNDLSLQDASWRALCVEVLEGGRATSLELFDPAGPRWLEIRISRTDPERIAQFFFDISERKQAQLRQVQMFEELNHRVKNSLAIVTSVLSTQARGAGAEARDALRKAVNRVENIAMLHEALQRWEGAGDVEFADYLGNLCDHLARGLAPDGRAQVRVEAEPLTLPADIAIPLGMIVNELVTNALKYGCSPSAPGTIKVRCHRSEQSVVLSVADDGPGLPSGVRSSRGLGTRIVSALVQQVRGTLESKSNPGACITIRVPRPDLVDPDGRLSA